MKTLEYEEIFIIRFSQRLERKVSFTNKKGGNINYRELLTQKFKRT